VNDTSKEVLVVGNATVQLQQLLLKSIPKDKLDLDHEKIVAMVSLFFSSIKLSQVAGIHLSYCLRELTICTIKAEFVQTLFL